MPALVNKVQGGCILHPRLHYERLEPCHEVSFSSFVVRVPTHHLPTFMKEEFWPEGVVYRKFRGRLPKPTRYTVIRVKCRPVCKSRRREWKGRVQNTSAELLLERKPLPECFRRCPTKIYPNSPCPLFGRTRRVIVNKRYAISSPHVVRVCQAPIDEAFDTPYLRYAEMVKRLGAWGAVRACCAFCECGPCCPCGIREYVSHDADRAGRRRTDMHRFDARVQTDCHIMRIMYDKF
ncbi:uncharacterized protein ACR2FA_009071 [Aphomia sociella]